MTDTNPTGAALPHDETNPLGEAAADDKTAIPKSSDRRTVSAEQALENRDDESPS